MPELNKNKSICRIPWPMSFEFSGPDQYARRRMMSSPGPRSCGKSSEINFAMDLSINALFRANA